MTLPKPELNRLHALKIAIYNLSLLIYVNLINIIFLIARLNGTATIRPVLVYDYLLIVILIAFRVPSIIVWVFFIAIFSLDLIGQISFTYLFSVPELLKNLEFSSLYSLSFLQYFFIFLFLAYLSLNLFVITKFTSSPYRSGKLSILFCCIFFILIYTFDYLNGGSIVNSRKILPIANTSVGGSSIRNVGANVINIMRDPQKPVPNFRSSTFQTFAEDTVGNQLLIIMESWGLPAEKKTKEKLKSVLFKKAHENGWTASFGHTPFRGTTTSSELRELLNVRGDYRYLINADSARQVESIFNIKKAQGYFNVAVHSFTGKMFERAIWWKNIGIDSACFLETVVFHRGYSNHELNHTTPFLSLNDEDAFLFLTANTSPASQKKFGYLLTENSHLPFYDDKVAENDNDILDFKGLSPEANSQMRRIQELIFFFMHESGDQWSKILIVGDHIPPCLKSSDRIFYFQDKTPFLILTRKH
jgi:hypothetical protein